MWPLWNLSSISKGKVGILIEIVDVCAQTLAPSSILEKEPCRSRVSTRLRINLWEGNRVLQFAWHWWEHPVQEGTLWSLSSKFKPNSPVQPPQKQSGCFDLHMPDSRVYGSMCSQLRRKAVTLPLQQNTINTRWLLLWPSVAQKFLWYFSEHLQISVYQARYSDTLKIETLLLEVALFENFFIMDTEERCFFLRILAFVSTSLNSTSIYDRGVGHASRVMSFKCQS